MAAVKKNVFNWGDVQKDCDAVAKKISDSGKTYDYIAAVSRGGLIPGVLISDVLGISDFATFRLFSYKGVGNKCEPKLVDWPRQDLSGKDVLLVDDISDTGHTHFACRQERTF